MINLENLVLYLSIMRHNKNYIDGNELYNDILIYMPQLNKFTFNIRTNIDKKNDGIFFSQMKIFNIVSEEKNMDSLAHVLQFSQHQLNTSVIAIHSHFISKVDRISIHFHINSKVLIY